MGNAFQGNSDITGPIPLPPFLPWIKNNTINSLLYPGLYIDITSLTWGKSFSFSYTKGLWVTTEAYHSRWALCKTTTQLHRDSCPCPCTCTCNILFQLHPKPYKYSSKGPVGFPGYLPQTTEGAWGGLANSKGDQITQGSLFRLHGNRSPTSIHNYLTSSAHFIHSWL